MRTTAAFLLAVALLIFCLGLFLVPACNLPSPPQVECAKSRGGCAPCVTRGCYWVPDPGSCWSKSAVPATDPVGFVQDCADGTAPFPDPVVSPMPYAKPRQPRDAGVPLDR